jgi:hypothetical protein
VVVAHAIAQVSGDRRGIHVLFSGPPAWLYAPGGFTIERRLWQRPKGRRLCADLRDAALAQLHRERELETPIGLATLRDGTWQHPSGGAPGTAEVLTVDLREPTPMATVAMPGPNWTAYGLQNGRVAAAGPAQITPGQLILTAPAIDRVVVHAQHADAWQICAFVNIDPGGGWSHVADVQLPLREADPSLADEQDEWDRARTRLLPGDGLDQPTFRELATALRALVVGDGGEVRPLDRSLRPDADSPETILGALDPLKLAFLDPVVRRALGFAYFDDDTALVLGETYQYRVSAKYPSDAERVRPGFHTVPVGTQVPADFFLGDVRVRLSQPSRVELAPTGAVEDVVVGRRAIPVGPRESPHWLLPELLDAALVLDFAAPRNAIVLQLADADLQYEAFDVDSGGVGGGDIAGTGDHSLAFSGPAARVILRGKGRWLALREPLGSGVVLSEVTGPVVLAEPPPPPQPLSIVAVPAGLTAPSTNGPRPRSELGFDVSWRPALALDANAWPADPEAAPPLESTRFELEHEVLGEGFEPVFGKGGVAFGDRGGGGRQPVGPGADLMLLFPEDPPPPVGPTQDFMTRDHFLRDPEIAVPRPGTEHRYRVRALDEIGRGSGWVTSPPTLLEKRFPPPPPTGAPSDGGAARVAGVRARVLVRDAPDLTPADQALLDEDGSTTAIVLTWAWNDEQRALDPWASEFRVYTSAGGVGPVAGQSTSVTDLGGGRFSVDLTLARPVAANAARGSYLPAGGEYRILGHGAGTTIQATVQTLVPNEDGSFPPPRTGTTILPVPLAAAHNRPDAWDQRLEVVPLTAAEVYELVLLDVLLPDADSPREAVWLGVSAADAEPYVPDSFPGGTRSGNESPLVAVRCEARYQGRPELDAPPPIGDVPAVTTARATAAGVEHDLDLLPFLADSGLATGEHVVVELLSDGDLLAALRADGSDVVAVPPPAAPREADETPIPIPNPGDRANITTALADDPLGIADRYVAWLAASHPFADWLFSALEPAEHVLGEPVRFSLAAGGARCVVRVRRVDAAGHRSAGAATCAMMLHVPALAPLAPPELAGARWTATPDGPRIELTTSVPDERTTHLLTWIASTDPRGAALATVGSRRDLPGFGVRLRTADGGSLTPSILTLEPEAETVTALEDVGPGPHFVWLAAVDEHGVPSRLAGAFRLPPRTA